MDANQKQYWYERVTKSKKRAESNLHLLSREIKESLYEGDELKQKYAILCSHRSQLLVHKYLLDIDGEINTNKELGDVLQTASLYWECKAVEYWIKTKEDYVAGEDLRKNLHLQKQAKSNAIAFNKWRNKFSKFRKYQIN